MTRLRRTGRRLGTTLIVLGIAVMLYAGAVVFWRDPVTDVYTAYQQHQLVESLNHDSRQWSQQAPDTFARHPVSTARETIDPPTPSRPRATGSPTRAPWPDASPAPRAVTTAGRSAGS